jgi:pyridoxal/pyridoxine/pyridoxamine kinase
VIVSSSKSFDEVDKNKLVLYASSKGKHASWVKTDSAKLEKIYFCIQKGEENLIRIEFDRLPGTFYGTGDAFAAMILAWLTKLKDLKVKKIIKFSCKELILIS